MDDFEDLNFLASPFQKISCPVFRFTFILLGKGSIKKKSGIFQFWSDNFEQFRRKQELLM